MYHNGSYEGMFKPEEVIDYLRKSQSDDPLLSVQEVLAKHAVTQGTVLCVDKNNFSNG